MTECMTDRRRAHYSTALAQAQGIVEECLILFETWEAGQELPELFETVRGSNLLNVDSESRMRNITVEGFGSRFLREPHVAAAPYIKQLLETAPAALQREIVLLYAIRQHGIFFDFLTEIYWPAYRASGLAIDNSEVGTLIDRGRINGRLERDWSASVRKRVTSYVMGTAADFGLVGKASRGSRPILHWAPSEELILYIAYDLHFLDLDDNAVVAADEWAALGLEREDVILYLNRLSNQGHLTVQDSGALCRVDWNYNNREQLNDAILRR